MCQSITPSPAPATSIGPDDDAWQFHPSIDDFPEDAAREAEYRASERRRFDADPSEADLAWWDELGRDDDDQEPDALLDARADDALGLDRLEAGLCC